MDRECGQELMMPSLVPIELYQASGARPEKGEL